MTAEPSTQQRPWAAVAPKLDMADSSQARAHFAAMFVAHDKALDSLGSALGNPEIRSAENTLVEVGTAAFVAAALSADDGLTLERALGTLWGGAGRDTAEQWLTAGGVNPAEIEAASVPSSDLAETTRLLRELYDTARDLDAWTSARHAEVLRKVEAHLAGAGPS